ncbi:MAG: alpha/beta hydrolase [Paracoccaceae bacterium]
MTQAKAPFHADVAPGPSGAQAFWAQTSDDLRIRLGLWSTPNARGTVFMFPGRTEYIEKYAPTAQELANRGLTTFAIDWRGQGLADRMTENRKVGHVDTFPDYQKDVAAMRAMAESLNLPKPWFLLAHSMGGCIGLRALNEGLPVEYAAFTGPMWGIRIAPHLQPFAFLLKHAMPAFGLGHQTPPTTIPDPYVHNAPFKNNMLTKDRAMWDMMGDQIRKYPDLGLGGPSYVWLREAVKECNWLHAQPSPDVPCVTYLGTDERIVHLGRIHDRMARWPNGHLEIMERGEHEVLVEVPEMRTQVFDDLASRFIKAEAA